MSIRRASRLARGKVGIRHWKNDAVKKDIHALLIGKHLSEHRNLLINFPCVLVFESFIWIPHHFFVKIFHFYSFFVNSKRVIRPIILVIISMLVGEVVERVLLKENKNAVVTDNTHISFVRLN